MSGNPGDDPHGGPYLCYRTRSPLPTTGLLDEPAWQRAPKSPRFADVVTGGPALYDTRAAALWDDESLYLVV